MSDGGVYNLEISSDENIIEKINRTEDLLTELHKMFDSIKEIMNNTHSTYDEDRFSIRQGSYLYDTYRYYEHHSEYVH